MSDILQIKLKPEEGIAHVPLAMIASVQVTPDGSGWVVMTTGLSYHVKDALAILMLLREYWGRRPRATEVQPLSLFESIFGKHP